MRRYWPVARGRRGAVTAVRIQVCLAEYDADAAAQFAMGRGTLECIRRDLWIEDRGLYAEKATADGERPTEPAFMWSAGVQLSALAAAARCGFGKVCGTARGVCRCAGNVLDRARWDRRVQRAAEAAGGRSILRRQRVDCAGRPVETAAATGDAKYLERAEATHRFVMSGEDDRLGGGVYWRENRRRSKNTCSNGPAIVGAYCSIETPRIQSIWKRRSGSINGRRSICRIRTTGCTGITSA